MNNLRKTAAPQTFQVWLDAAVFEKPLNIVTW